jgi:hypothetical protein
MKFLLFFAVSVIAVRAADIVTTDGKTYKDATIVKHDAVTATILDSEGGATVPLAKLSPDLQKKLGYDPAASHSTALGPDNSVHTAKDAGAPKIDPALLRAEAAYLDGAVIIKNTDGTVVIDCGPPPVSNYPDAATLSKAGLTPAQYEKNMEAASAKEVAEHGKPYYGICLVRGVDPKLAINDHVQVTAWPDGESGGYHAFTTKAP